MKKIAILAVTILLILSSALYAGGDKVCGDKAQGPAGDSGQGKVERNRAAD